MKIQLLKISAIEFNAGNKKIYIPAYRRFLFPIFNSRIREDKLECFEKHFWQQSSYLLTPAPRIENACDLK